MSAGAPPVPALPIVLLVTGVSGSGKSTVGSLLADRLGWEYAEGDAFHSAANRAKMAAGRPLDDADRAPWLAAIRARIDAATATGRPLVISCSALKRRYRDELRENRPNVRLIYLDGDYETIEARLKARHGHFFPKELLDSQFRALEPPADDEHPVRAKLDRSSAEIVDLLISEHVAD